MTDAAFLDLPGLNLDEAAHITYRVEQSFRYAYAAPVTSLAQRLVVVPRRRHGDLRRRSHRLRILGAAHAHSSAEDADGNTVVTVTAPRVDEAVEFRLSATLDRFPADGYPVLPASALRDPALLTPTALTTPDDAIRALAADAGGPALTVRAGGPAVTAHARGPAIAARVGDPEDVAERICHAVHAALAYEFGVTSIRTTAAQALAGGRGVCQDAAHVMLAACRSRGLPSRYVSGHLLGQGGTHAWVEVIVARGDAAVAVAFDPCHGRRTGNRYVTVAVGRDYADVAPTSGTFVGAPGGTLSSTRHVGVVAIA